jgi:hypothetical protein
MRATIRLTLATLGVAVSVGAAHAQDMTSATVNGTTVWIGGGAQYLSLPDVRYTGRGDLGTSFRFQKNSDFSEYGGSGGGGIETQLGHWDGWLVSGSVKGFFSSLENSDRRSCNEGGGSNGCLFFSPTGNVGYGFDSFVTHTNRDVDYWGGSAELKFGGEPVQVKPRLYRNDYFLVGGDIRGIDQDNRVRANAGFPTFNYTETLDTSYYGGYVGFGGEYSLGFLGVGMLDSMGIRSFISVRAGVYSADTDYNSRFVTFDGEDERLANSTDDVAFIGSISLETRKQMGPRTSLSLWTDYEFISSVPDVRYVSELGETARVGDDSAFATRTMLRLNIGLGSSQLYQEPVK